MSLVYGLSKAPTLGWGSHSVWLFIGVALVMLSLFLWNERRTKQPLMPLGLFKVRNVLGGNMAFLVIACTMFSMFFFLTLYVQTVLGYSPVKAGFCFLPVTIIIGMTSAVISNLVGKIGYKPPMVTGPLFLAIGLFILSRILKVGGDYWHNVFPGLAICAFGMGQTFVSGSLAATSGVPKHFSGLASGVLNTSQQIGGALGLAILSAVAFSTIKSEVASGTMPLYAQVNGYRHGLEVGIGLALTAVIVVLLVVKNHKVDAKKAMVEAI
jgi:predicted MFS family arabinose efflux permease